MSLQRWIRRSAPLAAAALASSASIAAAQSLLINSPRVADMPNGPNRQLFEWSGSVDREVQIVMRGNDVWTNNVGATERPRAREHTYSRLPNENGQVMVRMQNGRGNVDVIQQPNRSNNYTTIVRILDPRGGADDYRFTAYWEGYGNTNSVYGDDRRNRDNGGWDRGRDGNRDDTGGYNNGRNGGYDNGRSDRRDQEVLHFTGNVDDQLEIRIQNGRVTYNTLSGKQPLNVRATPGATGIRLNGTVGVDQNSGRGSVQVVQQPSQWNSYTTVIRVRDPQGGYGYYDFDLVWQN